jgi:hypothetical protein
MADPAGALAMPAAVVAGAGVIATGAWAGVVVADGAGADSDVAGDDELSLQAASASAQAAASRLGLMFIDRPPGWQSRIIEQRCSASREDAPPKHAAGAGGAGTCVLPDHFSANAPCASIGWLATYNTHGPPVACVAAS